VAQWTGQKKRKPSLQIFYVCEQTSTKEQVCQVEFKFEVSILSVCVVDQLWKRIFFKYCEMNENELDL